MTEDTLFPLLLSVSLLSSRESPPGEALTALLAPALDSIVSARTHLYLPRPAVLAAVEFLVSLLRTFLGGRACASRGSWEGEGFLTFLLLYGD